MSRLPLDLYHEVETATGGRFKWDANQAPGSRLRNFSFRTKIGEGFSDANGQLARRIDQDYPDLNLVNNFTSRGADGTVAYEGRMSAMPRDLSDTHSIGVTLTGWMAHAKDRKFQEIYVDRDMSNWTEPSLAYRAALAVGTQPQGKMQVTNGKGGVTWDVPAEALAIGEQGNLVYTAPPGCSVAYLGYQGVRSGAWGNFEAATLFTSDVDDFSTGVGTVALTLSGANLVAAVTVPARYGLLRARVTTAHTPAAGVQQRYDQLAAYGTGISSYYGDPTEPPGYYASDVLRDIATRFCPQLDTSGIQGTTYVIQHLAFKDPTFPYDAFLELNKYHLWNLGVWENKRLDFKPYDLTDYDWEIRTDDPGTTFSPQGPSTEDLFNGIAVTYTDLLTGIQNRITPDDDATLRDSSSTNPWNQHGIDKWDEITISTPQLEAGAVQIGVAALAEKNRAKTPGTITVKGYIRDRAGNDQPAWKPRAGDTIAVTNFPNDSPRLIVETDYNDEDKTIRIAVDRPFQLLEAYLDRVGNALGARGLT